MLGLWELIRFFLLGDLKNVAHAASGMSKHLVGLSRNSGSQEAPKDFYIIIPQVSDVDPFFVGCASCSFDSLSLLQQ